MNIALFAFRNILRNKRRTLVTVAAIATGFSSINIFGGYASNTFRGLRLSAVYGEGIGHLTIFKKGFRLEGKLAPKTYMISQEEMAGIKELAQKNPHIKNIIPKMELSGIISNGITSTIYISQGLDPRDEQLLKKEFKYKGQGSRISPEHPNGGQLGSALAKMLNLKVGDVPTLLTNTLDGQMNAVDLDVVGIYNTGSDATNDKFILMPLQLAQSLYNTTSVDRISILLDDVSLTRPVRKWLEENLPSIGFQPDIGTWDEMSLFYSKVHNLFNMIFLFIFCIVLLVVVTSVVNTMTMTVVERTREIGTLRALGIRRREILKIFGAEGLLIGVIGVVSGLISTIIIAFVISVSNITYLPPNIAEPVKLSVDIVPANMLLSGFFLIFLSFLAALFPSRNASKLKIVDALGHI